MRTIQKFQIQIGVLFLATILSSPIFAQNYNLNNKDSKMEILGTSNIHDWVITAEQQKGNIVLELENETLKSIKTIDFTVVAESLKSGKNGMDKNTYKALNTSKYKAITYQLEKVTSIKNTSENNFKVDTKGYLTIAGTKKLVDITFDLKLEDKSICISGSKSLKMSDFNIDAPTAVFGTITTGDQITIKYSTVFTK